MGNLLAKDANTGTGTSTGLSPNGLYTHCDWDVRVVKRLILEKKLAPMSVGREGPSERELLEECPICFLYYAGGLNRSRCCKKGICTECYLQVRRPSKPSSCPFCNQGQYIVMFNGPLSRDEIAKEQQEQLKVHELEVQMRKEEMERDLAREKEKQLKNKSTTYLQTDFSYSTSLPSSQFTPASPPERIASSSATPRISSAASSYPPVGHVESPTDAELEDLMLMEAIRLSLNPTSQDIPIPPSSPSSPPSVSSHLASQSPSSSTSSSLSDLPSIVPTSVLIEGEAGETVLTIEDSQPLPMPFVQEDIDCNNTEDIPISTQEGESVQIEEAQEV